MRGIWRYVTAAVVVGLCVSGIPVLAHEVTFKGTVISAAPTAVKVTVVDEKTKKTKEMAFTIDKDTKIFRGDKPVTFVEAKIAKDDAIAVTVNMDEAPEFADVIHLDVKK